MKRKLGRAAVDGGLAVLLLYLSFWFYEGGNYVAMLLVGQPGTLLMSGVLPASVVSAGQVSGLLVLAKPLQLFIVTGVALPIYLVLRRTGMKLCALASVGTLAVYLSSFYWELLTLVGFLPLALHELLFTLLSLGAVLLLTRKDPKLRALLW